MWETRESRENLGFLVAALALWLTGLAETGIEQRVLKRSLERIPCFPFSSSSLAILSLKEEHYLHIYLFICLFLFLGNISLGHKEITCFGGKS